MKKKILIIVAAVVTIILVGLVGFLIGKNSLSKEVELYKLIISINPKVQLNINKEGIVLNIIPLNDDAKIFNNNDFVNLQVETAVENILKISKENGYLKEDTVVNIDGDNEQLKSSVKNVVVDFGYKVNITNIDEHNNSEVITDENNNFQSNVDESNPSGENNEKISVETKQDEEPSSWRETDIPGIYKADASGYGDYISGEHVSLKTDGPVYYKFYETSKIGCKDAIDKKACATWYINDLTPRMGSVQGDLEAAINSKKTAEERTLEAKEKIIDLEKEISRCEATEDGCGHGFDGTHLNDLYGYLETNKRIVEINEEVALDMQDLIDVKTLEVQEYKKVLAVYQKVLSN